MGKGQRRAPETGSKVRIFTKFEIKEAIILVALEIIATIVLYGIIRLMYKKGVKKINVNGG